MHDPSRPPIGDVLERGAQAKQRFTRRWLAALVLLGSAAVLTYLFIGGSGDDTVHYRTEPVRQGTLTVTVTATGNLAPLNQVEVGSELSGIVESVAVDFNEQVAAGQVLARLDAAKLSAQVAQSRAALAAARARVLQAEATVAEARTRLDRLRRAGAEVATGQDLDSAEATLQRAHADVAMARATVAQAEATLNLHQAELAKAVIRSPISGVVLSRGVEPGQTVAASLQAPVLFTLAEDLGRMELRVAVDEADVGQVRQGQTATFTVDAYPGRTFPATVRQVRYGSQVVDGVVTYRAILDVDNSDGQLRPGMTATADIVVRQLEDTLLIPNAALRFAPPAAPEATSGGVVNALTSGRVRPPPRTRPGGQAVYTVQQGTLTAIPVRTGFSDGRVTALIEGDLAPDTPLVVGTRGGTG